ASEDAPGEPLGTPTYVVTEMLSHDAGIEQVSTTPLRARARQLEQLERAFQDAQRGAVVTRLIVGIAGAGKSRMLHEWRRRSWQATDLLLTAYATVHEHHSPFAPLLRMWRSWFGFPLDDPPQAIRERLQTVLEQAELPVEKFAAPLAYAFGAGDDIVSKQPAERRRHLVIQAFVELTIALAEKRLVVLAFEDLHFVDRSTLDVLRRLVESARPARLLLVLTARPEFVVGWPLANRISRIDVTPLGQSDALQLVESMSQRSSLPTALVRRIVDLSDGVPLVLEELVRAALSDWERDGEVADLMSRPPTSFADSVARRIEELGRARDLIRVAALLGRETPVTILRAVMQIGDEEFLSRLRKLELADLVHLRDVSGEPCCVFAHILIQEAAKDAIPAETSGALHASIVQVLDRDFSDRVLRNPERFAHLYATAGACERALALFELAANRAARDSAHDEAAAHLQAALSLLQSRTDATDVAIERRLRGALGPCLMAIEGWSAGAVAENLNRSRSLGDEASELRELWGTWAHGLVTHDVATVRNALAAVNRATPGAEQRFAVLSMEGVTAFYRGQFASSRRYLEQAVAMLPPLEGDAASVTDERVSLANARSWGCEFVVAASMHLAWLEALSGRRERAEAVRANAEAILAHLSSDGELRETRHALYMQIHLGLTLRDYEYLGYSGLASGTGPLYRLFELAGGRFPYYRCVAQFGEARARAAGGDGSAIDDLLIVYERMKTISSRPTGHVFLASILAEACIEAGRLSEAERLLDEAMQVADTEFGRFYAPEAYRLAAECALALGELRVARKRVRQARTACLTLDVPLESPVLHFERNLARTEASLVERVPLSPHSSDVSAPSALDDGHVADAKAQEPERRAALDEP
ncbi:MAG TPA: AAA family ATPase, partial [Polyangiaceae bacterium]|nr:AAA family ATPase [Polyangiaceae bacterium]